MRERRCLKPSCVRQAGARTPGEPASIPAAARHAERQARVPRGSHLRREDSEYRTEKGLEASGRCRVAAGGGPGPELGPGPQAGSAKQGLTLAMFLAAVAALSHDLAGARRRRLSQPAVSRGVPRHQRRAGVMSVSPEGSHGASSRSALALALLRHSLLHRHCLPLAPWPRPASHVS